MGPGRRRDGGGKHVYLPSSQVNLWHVHENITQDKGMQLLLLLLMMIRSLHLRNSSEDFINVL